MAGTLTWRWPHTGLALASPRLLLFPIRTPEGARTQIRYQGSQTEQASGSAPSSTCVPLTRTSRSCTETSLRSWQKQGLLVAEKHLHMPFSLPTMPSSGAELCMASSRLLLSGIALATGSSPTISTAARPSFPIPHPLIYLSQTFIFPRHSLQLLSCSETQRLWPILCIKLGWKVGARPKKANIRAGREQVWKGSVEF